MPDREARTDPPDESLPIVEPGGRIAHREELDTHPTKKFRLILDQGFGPKPAEALLVSFEGRFHAYLNLCRHISIPLDWMPNEFFDAEGKRLLCRTHGALYDPGTGACVSGPCEGRELYRVPIRADDSEEIRLAENADLKNLEKRLRA